VPDPYMVSGSCATIAIIHHKTANANLARLAAVSNNQNPLL